MIHLIKRNFGCYEDQGKSYMWITVYGWVSLSLYVDDRMVDDCNRGIATYWNLFLSHYLLSAIQTLIEKENS